VSAAGLPLLAVDEGVGVEVIEDRAAAPLAQVLQGPGVTPGGSA
jgi:hypothetical protein